VKDLCTSRNTVYVCFVQFEHCTLLKNVGTGVQEGHLHRMVPAFFWVHFFAAVGTIPQKVRRDSPLRPNIELYTWLLSDTVKLVHILIDLGGMWLNNWNDRAQLSLCRLGQALTSSRRLRLPGFLNNRHMQVVRLSALRTGRQLKWYCW